MIKELGSLGFFIKFNSTTASGKTFDIYSSASADTLLYSSSVVYRVSGGYNVIKSSVFDSTASVYVNGNLRSISSESPSVSLNEWVHITYSFNPKMRTTSSADFLVKFGNTKNSNFNIQNLYITDMQLSSIDIRSIHNEFTTGSAVEVGNTISNSAIFYDKDENAHTSSVLVKVFQPSASFNKYIGEVDVVEDTENLSQYESGTGTFIVGSQDFYIDGVLLVKGMKVLCLQNNKIYLTELTANLGLNFSTVSASDGDYIYVNNGLAHKDKIYRKNGSSVFISSKVIDKISTISNTDTTT